MSRVFSKDIIIIGGGIAGLWLLNRLLSKGYDAVLLDKQALGTGQTIASQGMIHGGVKYALNGRLTQASNTIADMPAYWKACLSGTGDLDLRSVQVLSQQYYMWPRQSLRSRMTAFLGSKALRGRIRTVAGADIPGIFQAHITGPLYELNDIVVDVPSLLETLSTPRDAIHLIDWQQARIECHSDRSISAIRLADGSELRARRFIFTAGEGNEMLAGSASLSQPPMQRRPLHMLMLAHSIQHPLYVHCVAEQLSSTPELTITSHPLSDGRTAWYLGGEIAESGVSRDRSSQIAHGRQYLQERFPWCDLSTAEWHSFHIDRAEPAQPGGQRPDDAFIDTRHNYMTCWPTKLTLAPALANRVLQQLTRDALMPGPATAPLPLPFPGIARTPWEHHFCSRDSL